MEYTQPRTSALESFLPPDPPEAPPPEAGPPDRESHFKGLLEGHTNARTAPAEGEKKKGPRANSAAPAEGSPAPQHEGASSEAPQGTGTTGTPAEGSPAEAAAQSEPNATLIGGEASGAAGAAVAVGAATAAPLTSSSGEAVPGGAVVPEQEGAALEGKASSVAPTPGQIVVPAAAEAVTGGESVPMGITVPTTPSAPKTGEGKVTQAVATAGQGETPMAEVPVEGREQEGSPKDQGSTKQGTTPVPQPKGDETATAEAPASESTPPMQSQSQATGTTSQPTVPTGTPAAAAAPTQAPANSPTQTPSFASPQGPAPSPASALEATVRLAAENGYSRARVALRPAELGGIELFLRNGSEGITATVVAETPHTAQLLQHSASDLQRRLSAQGIELTFLQIGVGGDSAGAAQGGRDQGGEASPTASGTRTGSDEDPVAAPEQTQTIDLGGGVLVDVLA